MRGKKTGRRRRGFGVGRRVGDGIRGMWMMNLGGHGRSLEFVIIPSFFIFFILFFLLVVYSIGDIDYRDRVLLWHVARMDDAISLYLKATFNALTHQHLSAPCSATTPEETSYSQ